MNPLGVRLDRCIIVPALLAALQAGGCAFGDRHIDYEYEPVMRIKAERPSPVTVVRLDDDRQRKNPKQIGQIRNAYGMITAKVLCAEGDPTEWIARALASELTKAGFQVTRSESADPSSVVVSGRVDEFFSDMGMDITLDLKVRLTVTKQGRIVLDREYTVDEGSGSLTAGEDYYEDLTRAALTKLMRRAIPDIIEAIE